MRYATETAFERIIAAIQQTGRQVKHDKPRHAMAQCPAHEDGRPSLSVSDTDSQALLYCFAGCHHEDIMGQIGLSARDMFNDVTDGPYGLGAAVRYRYPDGRENWRSATKKDFRRDDRHAKNHPGGKLLYRSDQVGDATTIYVCEGEKDADAVASLGGAVVACPGSQSPEGYDWTPLHGRQVLVLADRDEAGKNYAEAVTAILNGHTGTTRIALARVGKDAADHIAAGLGLDQLVILAPDAETHQATLTRYPALDLAKLLDPNRPAREYVVIGLLPAGIAASLSAPAGTGKSLLALAIAINVSRGTHRFAGLDIPRPRRVLYVDMENSEDDLAERFDSFGLRMDDDLGELTYLSLPPLPPLDTAAGADEFVRILDAYQIGTGDLVILDSLQRVIQGPENDSDTMRAYYLRTGLMLKRRGITSLRLDNTGKDVTRGSRGTSGKRDDVDLELVMIPDEEDPERFVIKVNKTRLSDTGQVILTRYIQNGRTVFTTENDPVRTHVNECREELDRLGVPLAASLSAAREALYGRHFLEQTMRIAMRERRSLAATTRPSTGCDGCGQPMTSLGDGATTHPGCEAS